eukprot:4780543-Pyramimonas_sp.AAC.2
MQDSTKLLKDSMSELRGVDDMDSKLPAGFAEDSTGGRPSHSFQKTADCPLCPIVSTQPFTTPSSTGAPRERFGKDELLTASHHQGRFELFTFVLKLFGSRRRYLTVTPNHHKDSFDYNRVACRQC